MKLSKPIGTVLGIVTSILLALSGILLCISCLSIYRSAEANMFTYEKIGEAFSKIAVPIYITLAAIALGAIYLCYTRLSSDGEKEKLKVRKNLKATVAALAKRVDTEKLPEDTKATLAKERDLRRTLKLVNTTLCVLSAVLPPIYLLNPELYLGTTSSEVSAEVLYCFLFYLVCLLPLAVYNLLYTILAERSLTKEAELLKSIVKNSTNSTSAQEARPQQKAIFYKNKKAIILCLQIAIFATAGAFIILGIFNGGMQDVWKKAAEICAECIGLG